MIVSTLEETEKTTLFGDVNAHLLVSESCGVGHILIEANIKANTLNVLEKNISNLYRVQACYCIEGNGIAEIEGKEHQIIPGTLIASSLTEPLTLIPENNMRILGVFCKYSGQPHTIIRNLEELYNTERDVFWGNGRSRRYLIRKDSMGFSLCNTTGNTDTDSFIQYRNHFESCYYISGSGEYEWDSGRHPILTGENQATIFIMNDHDSHHMRIKDEAVCISIFTPPIEGYERHNFSSSNASSY